MEWELQCKFNTISPVFANKPTFLWCGDSVPAQWFQVHKWQVESIDMSVVSMVFGCVLFLWVSGVGVGLVIQSVRQLR